MPELSIVKANNCATLNLMIYWLQALKTGYMYLKIAFAICDDLITSRL